MSSLSERISSLSLEKRKLLEMKLKNRNIDISKIPIVPADRKNNMFPVSYAQQRLWFMYQYAPEDTTYNMLTAVEISGEPDITALEKSINMAIKRHETLRTRFMDIDGIPYQIVEPDLSISLLETAEIRSCDGSDRYEAALELIRRDVGKPFNLYTGPLIRAKLYAYDRYKYIMTIVVHHIVSDGWSTNMMVKELLELYKSNCEGRNSTLAPLTIQYADYSCWQHQWLKGDMLDKELEYWKQQLHGAPYAVSLPSDHPRPSKFSHKGKSHMFHLSEELAKKLGIISLREGVTLFMTLLTSFKILLHQYTQQEDITVGTPIAGRNRFEIEQLIGFFVNIMILRTDFSGDPTFSGLLKKVAQTAIDAYSHQNVPFEKLVEELCPDRDMSYTPFSQVMFIFQNSPMPILKVKNIAIKPLRLDNGTSKADLTLELIEKEAGIDGILEYNTDLFEDSSIIRMKEHFVLLLENIAAQPDARLSGLPLLSTAENHRIFKEWNNTKVDYDYSLCLHQMFRRQVKKTPDATALVYAGKKISFCELEQHANRLSNYLVKCGIEAGELVGLSMERSFESYIAILGILKAGGVYVPLDSSYPKERIRYMLKDSGVRIVITKVCYKDSLPVDKQKLIFIDSDWNKIKEESTELPCIETKPESIAYMIYTSGSTGNPKGVLASHYSAINRFEWMWAKFPFGTEEVCCHKTSLNFVDSIWEVFGPLLKGTPVVVISDDIMKDPAKLMEELHKYKVTRITLVPSVLDVMLDSCENAGDRLKYLKLCVVSGEELSAGLAQRFRKAVPHAKLINLYGSSEVAADVTCYDTGKLSEAACKVPIGKPISNTSIYILDKDMRQVQEGVFGELYIGGSGVAYGYLNRPDLTAEKFVPDPFSSASGVRLFKTGDIGRYLSDGNIEFAGRKDNQVKIRGMRAELGEIEAVLLKHKSVKEAVVTVYENENKNICAYLVIKEDTDLSSIREYLAGAVPEYMVPTYILALDKLPLLPNGKLNRKVLPMPDKTLFPDSPCENPANEVEERLVEIWKELLHLDAVGIKDSFFERGGHSLKATMLAARIHKVFDIVIPVGEIFKRRTIRELAQYILGSEKQFFKPIERLEERDCYKVSSAQKRLFVINHLEGASIKYNLPNVIRLDGCLDYDKFEEVFKSLLSRHELLRTSFKLVDSEPVQVVHEEYLLPIDYQDAREDEIEAMTGEFIRPFDLSIAPLLRVKLLKIHESLHILLFDMHHIISDGTSIDILINEFITLYNGMVLKKLPVQYKDFSAWQNSLLKRDEMKRQEEFWLEVFFGGIPVLDIPTDYPRPSKQSYEGDSLPFIFDSQKTSGLKKLAGQNSATLYMVLLAVFNVLLSRYSGQEDIIVGSPVAGRKHPELENIIGVFINTLAMRNYPAREKTFRQFLAEVRDNSLKAFENEDYQFESLVERLDLPRDMSRNPLIDVMLIFHNNKREILEASGIRMTNCKSQFGVSKYDMTLNVVEKNDELLFELEYSTRLFKKSTMESFVKHFENLVGEITANPDILLGNAALLSYKEKEKILYKFNDTNTCYQEDKAIHQLFEEQVRKTPDLVAVTYNDYNITYAELDMGANRIACILRAKGVKPNSIVGIMVDRSHEMLSAILGVLKAGGAYLPIDPEYPADRIEYILQDSKACILIIDSKYTAKVRFGIDIVELQAALFGTDDYAALQNVNEPQDLAYMIYTSGSTGKPKGVMIEHKAVNNFIKGITDVIDFDRSKTILTLTTISFDIFVLETLLPLVKGVRIVVADEKQQRDMKQLSQLIIKNNVSMMQATPSRVQLMLDGIGNEDIFENLKEIMIGGEAFPSSLLESLKKVYKGKIYNMYGPTETTVWSAVKDLTNTCKITIGKPIANTRIFILDKSLNVQPVKVPGDLYIGGEGLARGYYNRPELTADRFIPNPHLANELMYKTGDIARWLEDGDIEFISRADQQVKIRGYRIELGEIESLLLQYQGIKEAVVDKRGDSSNAYLCAYIVAQEKLNASELREYLAKKLPGYMIPQYFVQLERIPLTPNKKINRLALPEPEGPVTVSAQYVQPRNTVEKELALIWQKILNTQKIGVNDNFFELGGNSILLMQMHSEINKHYPGLVDITDIFGYPTISRIVELISSKREDQGKSLELKTVKLPQEYFHSGFSDVQDNLLKVNINNETYGKVSCIAEEIAAEPDHVMLSAYLYMLSKIAGLKQVSTYSCLSGQGDISLLEVNLDSNEFKNLTDYISYVMNLSNEQSGKGWNVKRIIEQMHVKKEQEAMLLYCKRGTVTADSNLLSAFDVVFELDTVNSKASILCEYDGRRLRKEKVREMLQVYNDILEAIIEDFQ
jgi:amino acid adenylation domain-containing protein